MSDDRRGAAQRHAEALFESVRAARGATDRPLREAVAARVERRTIGETTPPGEMPAAIAKLVDAIAVDARTADVDALLASGRSDDEALEVVLTAATSAGLVRMRLGLAAMQSAKGRRS